MKSPLTLLLALVVSATAASAQGTPAGGAEPAAPGAVTITGSVAADGTGAPLPFSTVRIDPLGRERFTDRSGAFVYYAIAPGDYKLHLRMLGYLPIDTAITVRPNVPMSLKLRMTRIPTALEEVKVSAPPRKCIFPDEMGYVGDMELATVLEEARKNAQREQLLRRTYPFEYQIAQSHETFDLRDSTRALMYDTVTYRSNDRWQYRKGKMVEDNRSRIFGDVRLMRLPTMADLADKNFLSAHCFKYTGIVDDGGRPAHKIDFFPDSTLIAPDVEGSIYMDSATYLIRRARFRLTRGGTVKPAILGMEVTTTYREILPKVALFDEIHSVQPLGVVTPGGNSVEFREVQRLLSYRFIYGGPPGTQEGHKWIPAGADPLGLASADSVTVPKFGKTPTAGPPPSGPAPRPNR